MIPCALAYVQSEEKKSSQPKIDFALFGKKVEQHFSSVNWALSGSSQNPSHPFKFTPPLYEHEKTDYIAGVLELFRTFKVPGKLTKQECARPRSVVWSSEIISCVCLDKFQSKV